FSRPHDKAFFYVIRLSPIDDLGLHDPRPCGDDPGDAFGLKRTSREDLGERGELELCERRDQDRPMQYVARRSMRVDDNWIECNGRMDGTETSHGDDASNYTETQR